MFLRYKLLPEQHGKGTVQLSNARQVHLKWDEELLPLAFGRSEGCAQVPIVSELRTQPLWG